MVRSEVVYETVISIRAFLAGVFTGMLAMGMIIFAAGL